ncbi:tyrosine-type recombinase/integrase [Hirschia litorea]|uniref:Tyrosine-type recombinase/integrase n=1 Tax=Hirschia litorea TaxID=1199156 RepID=A0ABW2ILL7_9PROT
MPLNDLQIKKLRATDKQLKKADGGGLYLEVNPKGSKLWRMAYRFEGKQKLLSFGKYPEVSLAKAREKRFEAKTLLADGIDPQAKKNEERKQAIAETQNTFSNLANELIEKKIKEGRADSTITKIRWCFSLVDDALGHRAVADIKSPEVLDALRVIEAKGNYETAHRVRGLVGEVFRYAIATGRADYDPTFALKGALVAVQVTHRAAVTDWNAFKELLAAVWSYEGASPATRAALKLMAILYPRPGELRLSRWDEFDLKQGIWEIPKERTKMRRPHQKPLPPLAINILKELHEWSGDCELPFRSDIGRAKPISENTMNQALRRLGYGKTEMVSHGFRATASTLLNESGKWDADAIEAELAHVGSDEIRRAYHRGKYWDERIRMSNWWAQEIEQVIHR